ncbi:MAG: 3-oxo-tetronate kinase [Sphaerochaetaceae bacterium]
MKPEKKNRILIGCFADDFTGASDIGSFFVKGGLNTLLINGIPDDDFAFEENIQAIVIALKSRNQEPSQAIADSLKACTYFRKLGCEQIYFKYCSTFDSTKKGNIGPVADAVLETFNFPYTILCPALPINGRTVKNGCLYVNGEPLHESPMKHHPINPMWDSRIKNLMKPQSKYDCLELSIEALSKKKLYEVKDAPYYIVPDYYEDNHGELIAGIFKNLPFLTGGSGLAEHLANEKRKELGLSEITVSNYNKGTSGASIILAGSCSSATREQVKNFIEAGGKSIELNPRGIQENTISTQEIITRILADTSGKTLVHTTGNGLGKPTTGYQGLSQQEISQLYESKMAEIAVEAVKAGITRIITAGGETSGAITKALGFHSYYLSQSVAPGVPVMIPTDKPHIRLVLKSGNFGQPDFFTQALEATSA